jgi:hypothetical protein
VTSERGTVTAVDPGLCLLSARMDDGRDQLFAAEDMTADRLDYGYATTVHRAQGATMHTAQLLDLGRSLPRSQRPIDTPDLGLEL